MSTTLITAANGKVGHALAHHLASRGLSVRAGVHDPKKAKGRLPAGVEVVPLDLSNADSVAAALEGIDTVALITPPSPAQVDQATLMIDLAKEAGVRRVVRLSILAAAMEPGIQLGRWHRTVERYLQASGLAWSILRPGPFFQNLFGMYGPNGSAFELPVSDAAVNHIDVGDVAAFFAELVVDPTHDGQVHMVTGPEALRFSEIAERLSRATGTSYRYTVVEADEADERLAAQLPAWLAPILSQLFAAFRSGAVGMKTSTFEDVMRSKPRDIDAFARALVDKQKAA
jgi:uncharacterized protein YbjT (DUF2867 family)